MFSQPLSTGSPPGTFPEPIVPESAKAFLRGGFSVQSGIADSFLLIPSGNPSIAFLTSWPIFSTALVVEAGLKGLVGGHGRRRSLGNPPPPSSLSSELSSPKAMVLY